MNKYEELLDHSESSGISVDENFPFKGKLLGLYVSGNIALSDRLETSAEKSCILAEELGHYHTSWGNILDLTDTSNRKQEHLARAWAYEHMAGLQELIAAHLAGCRNRYEIAEYLNITEAFLQEAVDAYRNRFGIGTYIDGYYIRFDPNLQITATD